MPWLHSAAILSRISSAALVVKVMARSFSAGMRASATRYARRCTRVRVFPVPAPAIISSGPSIVCAAARWLGLRE